MIHIISWNLLHVLIHRLIWCSTIIHIHVPDTLHTLLRWRVHLVTCILTIRHHSFTYIVHIVLHLRWCNFIVYKFILLVLVSLMILKWTWRSLNNLVTIIMHSIITVIWIRLRILVLMLNMMMLSIYVSTCHHIHLLIRIIDIGHSILGWVLIIWSVMLRLNQLTWIIHLHLIILHMWIGGIGWIWPAIIRILTSIGVSSSLIIRIIIVSVVLGRHWHILHSAGIISFTSILYWKYSLLLLIFVGVVTGPARRWSIVRLGMMLWWRDGVAEKDRRLLLGLLLIVRIIARIIGL